MKRRTLPAIFWLSLLWWGLQTSVAQTLEGVIAKHVEAIGGAEKWRKATSLKARAVVVDDAMQLPAEADMRADLTVLHAVGVRVNVNIHIKSMNMKMSFSVMISSQTGGWQVTKSPGEEREVKKLSDDEYRSMSYQMHLQPVLLDYAKKGHTFALKDATEKVQKEKCYVIEGQLKGGDTVSFYIDTKKYYLRKMVRRSGNEEVFFYDNFREVDGYVLPFKETSLQEFEGLTQERIYTYESKTLNMPVDEGVFEPDEE